MQFQSCFKMLSLLSILALVLAGCGGEGETPSGRGDGDGRATTTDDDTAQNGSGSETDGGEEEIPTEGWGHLKGKFIVTGAPEPLKIEVTGNDVAYCGQFEILDESVVAGENGELANVVLTLYTKRGEDPPEPHESYAETAEAEVVLDNHMCRFKPHVQLLRTSQTLVIKNSDTVGHNTKINSENHPINPILPPNQVLKDDQFDRAERLPAPTSCNIHPWMSAWLVISDTPYMAVSDKNGEFLIENLPAGKHTFTVWHEAGGYVDEVEVNGEAKKWSRGRVDVVIRDKETTDLGEVKMTYLQLSGS